MPDRRPTNSELHLQQLEEQELLDQQDEQERGILELFGDPSPASDEPLARDDQR